MLNGSTQSKGNGATCWQMIFVVAKSAVQEQAAKTIHQRRGACAGPLTFLRALRTGSGFLAIRSRIRSREQRTEKIRTSANKPDQPQACTVNAKLRSTKNGYDTSPSSDPRLDSAYK